MTTIKRLFILTDNSVNEIFDDIDIVVEIDGEYHPEDTASEFSPPSDAYMEITDYRYDFPKSMSVRAWRHMSLVLKELLDNNKKKIEQLLMKQYNLDKEVQDDIDAERIIEDRGTE